MESTIAGQLFIIGSGMLSFSTLLVLPFAVLATIGFIALFQRSVRKSMEASAGFEEPTVVSAAEPARRADGLEFELTDAGAALASTYRTTPAGIRVRQRLNKLAVSQTISAAAFSLIIASFFSWRFLSPPGEVAILASIVGFVLFFLEALTPALFAAVLMLRGNALSLLIATIGLLTVLWLAGWATGTDPIGIWVILGGLPAVLIMVLSIRKLRGVGLATLAASIVLVFGVIIGVCLGAFHALQILDVRFVHPDFEGLSLWEGGWALIAGSEDFTAILANISIIAADTAQYFATLNPDAEREAALWFWGIVATASLVAIASFWSVLRSFARRYAKRRASDQILSVDAMMLTFALWGFLLLSLVHWSAFLVVPCAYLVYRVLSRLLLQGGLGSEHVQPRTLLLLRVFGFARRAQALVEDFEHRWRFLGPIRVTGSPDLAYSTIKPYEFFEFLNRRLTRRFVRDDQDLEKRLAPERQPDIDGSFRIEDFYCHNDTWKMTVSRLGSEADAVAMDLRSFSPGNKGCIFEIENLIATVPVSRIVLLTDHTTDLSLLKQVLQRAWDDMPGDSPNATGSSTRIRVLMASSRRHETIGSLLALLASD